MGNPSLFDEAELASHEPCRWALERCPALSRCALTRQTPGKCAWYSLGDDAPPEPVRPAVSDYTDTL